MGSLSISDDVAENVYHFNRALNQLKAQRIEARNAMNLNGCRMKTFAEDLIRHHNEVCYAWSDTQRRDPGSAYSDAVEGKPLDGGIM